MNTTKSIISDCQEVREYVIDEVRRYRAGEVKDEAVGRVGYAGMAVAATSGVELLAKRMGK